MTWKMQGTTAERLKRHATVKARQKSRSSLSERLEASTSPHSMLSDMAQDELVLALQLRPWDRELAFDTADQALLSLRREAPSVLPELSVFLGWSISNDAAVLLRLSDGLRLLERDFGFFSPDGCYLTAPDGTVGVVFDFDAPPGSSPGYLHFFGEGWQA